MAGLFAIGLSSGCTKVAGKVYDGLPKELITVTHSSDAQLWNSSPMYSLVIRFLSDIVKLSSGGIITGSKRRQRGEVIHWCHWFQYIYFCDVAKKASHRIKREATPAFYNVHVIACGWSGRPQSCNQLCVGPDRTHRRVGAWEGMEEMLPKPHHTGCANE